MRGPAPQQWFVALRALTVTFDGADNQLVANAIPAIFRRCACAGLSPTVGSAGFTAFNLGGVAGAIVGAWAFARIGSRVTMLVIAGGATAGALLLQSMRIAATSDPTSIIAVLGLTGGLIIAVQTTAYALAAQI